MAAIQDIRVSGISKVFPGTVALDAVDFTARAGEVSVLIGENGAGKSTLMRILAGLEQPTTGTITLNDREVKLGSVSEAIAEGIGMIHQELNLFPDMTIAENIFIGRELTRNGVIQSAEQKRRARQALDRVGLEISEDTYVRDLYVGQQQLVEIARALEADASILIMDEPTSALSDTEVRTLFRIIDALREQKVAIIYISHRLDEIIHIGDRVTVLRDGRKVAEDAVRAIDTAWIVAHMTGEAGHRFEYGQRAFGVTVLRVRDLSMKKPNGSYALDHVSFELKKNEVVSIFGLMGAGRTELLEAIYGLNRMVVGEIELDREALQDATLESRLARGLALVPEDRQSAGIVQSASISGNMVLSSLDSLRVRRWLPWLSKARERHAVAGMAKGLAVKAASPDHNIETLSGGNMQKVVLGKALLSQPKVLMLDEPTRGVDVGAKAAIYTIIREAAERGVSVLYTTSELDEALAVADRILVLREGRIAADFSRGEATRDGLMKAASPSPVAGEPAHGDTPHSQPGDRM